MIYAADAKGPYRMPGVIDPNAKKAIGVIYRPDTWQANNVYYVRSPDDYAVVIPTSFAGMYYKATNPGKSGATEPTWPTTVGATVTDGSVVWEAVAYNLMAHTETISSATFTASDGVTLGGVVIVGGSKVQTTIATIPSTVLSFTVTNHIVKSNGEEDDVTLYFKVAPR